MATYAATGPKKGRKKKLDDVEILTKVQSKVKECIGWNDSQLSVERQKVIQYYNSKAPKQQHRGSSSYISSDVYDSVEAMKSQILETFSGNGDELISFPPLHEQDAEGSRIATEYCTYVVWSQNPATEIFHDVLHDGLTARLGVTKVFWEEKADYEDHDFEGIPYDDVMALASQEEVSDLEAEADDTGMFAGSMSRKIDRSQVTISAVPPEEFAVSSRAKKLKTADAVDHRTPKTKAELKLMYPDFASKIDNLSYDASAIVDSPEALERNAAVENGTSSNDAIQPELDKLEFHETYVLMSLDKERGVCRYKVCWAGTLMFACDEVDRVPFFPFVPLPVPHTLWGNNFAQRIIPTQNARTVLTRGVLDHTSITVNPRWLVVKGGLLNPKEMLDNRQGGLVNTNRQDAVQPLQYANLNPFVFQTIEMLKSNKEENTGISSLSQGLNKDAVSKQNSQGLVGDLVNMSQTRQKTIARRFADYLVEIYLEVYRLVLENEKQQKIVEVAGNFVPVTPQQWVERTTCKVKLHLGYGERDRKAAQYSATYQQLSSDPTIAHYFSPPKKHVFITDGLKIAGFDTPSKYLEPAETPPPPPDPFKTKELENDATKAQAALITAQAHAAAKQSEAMFKTIESKLDQFSSSLEAMFKQRESDRLDLETANRVDVSQREIKLAESAPPDTTNTIVSANG